MSAEASASAAPPGPAPLDSLRPGSTTSNLSLKSPTMPHPPSTSSSMHHPSNLSHSTLPHSPEQLRQIAEARTALDAQMLNIGSSLDRTMQSRAQNLHDNSKQLEKQQKDVVKTTEGLRKENDKLKKMAEEGSRKVKELGNVQNWAEMLERDFLVLGETLRLANRGSESGSSHTNSEDGSWETESEDGYGKGWREHGVDEEQDLGLLKYVSPLDGPLDGEGDTQMDDGPVEAYAKDEEMDTGKDGDTALGKGKQVVHMDTDTASQTVSIEERNYAPGGSSTATATGSTTDPSSSSIHTAASATN